MKPIEMILFTGPPATSDPSVRKRIRSNAMKDFRRRQREEGQPCETALRLTHLHALIFAQVSLPTAEAEREEHPDRRMSMSIPGGARITTTYEGQIVDLCKHFLITIPSRGIGESSSTSLGRSYQTFIAHRLTAPFLSASLLLNTFHA